MLEPILGIPYAQVDALNQEARQVWHSHPERARMLAEQARTLIGTDAYGVPLYEKGWMDSLVMLAQCGARSGFAEQAIQDVQRALDFYQRHGICDEWHLNAYYTLGVAYSQLGDHPTGLEWYQRLVTLAQTMDDEAYLASGLRNLGSLHGEQEDYPTAVYFYEQAERHFERAGVRSGLASVYTNLCWAYLQMQRLDVAIDYGRRALSLSQENGIRDGEALTYNLIGNALMQQGAFDEAAAYFNSSIRLAREIGAMRFLADGLLNMGRLHARREQLDEAIDYARQALVHAEAIQHKYLLRIIHQLLYQCFRQRGEWQNALEHHEHCAALTDAIRTEASMIKLRTLEVQHKTRQAQHEAETQRRLREEDRRYYEHLTRMKDEILNTASHDLKSPIVGIKITADSLRRHGRLDDARGQELLGDIERTIKQMGDMVTHVLDLAKLETGRALSFTHCDLATLIREVVSKLSIVAQQKAITIRFHAQHAPTMVECDAHRLQQVLHNLVSNAIKYTPGGGLIDVHFQVDADSFTVSVADSGIGIPAYALPHVFERFYRVPEAAHQNIEGTGLGLAITKAIIDQHNGRIWVESVPGVGSTFSFTLPRVETASSARQQERETSGKTSR